MTLLARLPHNGNTEREVFQYFHTRALQLAPNGLSWCRTLTKDEIGYLTHFTDEVTGKKYDSFYVIAENRGNGNAYSLVQKCVNRIVTVADCNIIDFLTHVGADFCVETGMFDSVEYELVQEFYGSRRAERSGVFLMNHIDEGLYLLHKLNASQYAKRAFCLHPLLQTDKDLEANFDHVVANSDTITVALAMEYRNQANAWLSDKVCKVVNGTADEIFFNGRPTTGPLLDVLQMLQADKIQNYKDFLLYHDGKHARSKELNLYFKTWFNVLGVTNFSEWFNDLLRINPTDPNTT